MTEGLASTASALPALASPAVVGLDDAETGLHQLGSLGFFRKLAGGVTVVTSRDARGPVGLTASAVTSVSLSPPQLLVCLAVGSRTLAALRVHRTFAVNLLRDDQQEDAAAFARRVDDPSSKFGSAGWREVLGVPVLAEVLAWSVCFVEDDRVYGDHSIVVGRLVAARHWSGLPLVWHDRSYFSPGPADR